MPSLHNITPYQAPGRRGWNASFRDASGTRVTRGLGTRDADEAQLVCRALALLDYHKPASPADASPSLPPRALALYFGAEAVAAIPFELRHPVDAERLARVMDLDDPNDLRVQLAAADVARAQLTRELDDSRVRVATLEAELALLGNSMLGQAVEAGRTCPPVADAFEQYERFMRTASMTNHATEMISAARRFVATLPPQVRTPIQITPAHIGKWLDDTAGVADNPVIRRHRNRVRVGRFVNWCARTWSFKSPMASVRPAKTEQIERHQTEIHWHEISEVEAVLKALPDPYWRALVGTLAFAGLRLAELAWLRRSDIEDVGTEKKPRRQLWVSPVDDGHGEKHELKTDRSRRAVHCSKERLVPLLDEHLATCAGEVFAFPLPPDMQRRNRASGHPERWRVDALSRRLSGYGEKPGLLPEGMTARSLRRTFGSLLLRSGRAVAEVAAAMGNTPDVVEKHYARIIGTEVTVKF